MTFGAHQMRTQSFLNLLRPQTASTGSLRMSASHNGPFPGLRSVGYDASYIYRTTNDSTYGSFTKPNPMLNTTGPLRQPLFLAGDVGRTGLPKD